MLKSVRGEETRTVRRWRRRPAACTGNSRGLKVERDLSSKSSADDDDDGYGVEVMTATGCGQCGRHCRLMTMVYATRREAIADFSTTFEGRKDNCDSANVVSRW